MTNQGFKRFGLAELSELSRGRLGLLIGPGATTAEPRFLEQLRGHIAGQYQLHEREEMYFETAERAVAAGALREEVQQLVVSFTNSMTASPMVSQLSKLRWTAVLSISLDSFLETQLKAYSLRRAARRDVTVLTQPDDVPPAHTLPAYKLLGASAHGDVVTTAADYLFRAARLHSLVRAFLDELRGAPLLCAGFQGGQRVLGEILGHIYADARRRPSSLLFLLDDPLAESARVAQLVPSNSTFVAEGSLVEVARALEPQPRSGQASFSFTSSDGEAIDVSLAIDSDTICIVNSKLEPDIDKTEKQRLLDYLFMPDLPNWNPIAHDMDFPRTLLGDMNARVVDLVRMRESGNSLVVLHGRAASGKTILLKRFAFTLAQQGYIVAWLLDSWKGNLVLELERVLRSVQASTKVDIVVLVADGPARLRDFSPSAVFAAANRLGLSVVLVIGIRSSHYRQVRQDIESDPSLVIDREWELPDELDQSEWERFPDYLVALGIAPTKADACREISGSPDRRGARDSLALLYYLLPQTRAVIAGAIEQEYASLGSSRALREIVVGAVKHSAQKLQDAYGMVAVSARYGAAVPTEVLVSSLTLGYVEWVEAVESKGPAWGILYPDDTDDLAGSTYRTRNDVVTDAVLRVVNGGTLGHAGEVALLQRLLSACNSSSPVYADFCQRILVPSRNLESLEYHEGVQLYDAALHALPTRNAAILHHKGLWVRRKGKDFDLALAIYDSAIAAQRDPTASHSEAEEFIHTSKAAAIIDKVDHGQLTWEQGQPLALAELEQSRSPGFINAHAVHVYAKLVERLVFRDSAPPEADQYELVNRALADIDRTLLVMRSAGRRGATAKSTQPLEQKRDEILMRFGDLETGAARIWAAHHSQHGFVLVVRRLLASAFGRDNTGTEYKLAFEKWQGYRATIETSGTISPEFAEVGLTLFYAWQVAWRSRRWKRTVRSPIDWKLLQTCAEAALLGERYKQDPFYRFVFALSLAHQGSWSESQLAFQSIRRLRLPNEVLFAPRSYYLHAEGVPWRVQGKVRAGATKDYFNVDELQQDFETSKGESFPTNGAITHAYIVFSFAGPRVTRSEHVCGRVD